MSFDGIVIANLTSEIKSKIQGGKVAKIAQPEKDELLLTIKNNRETLKLLLSANAGLPLVYLTDVNKQGPMTAPGFCMLLRKHIGNARVLDVSQPGLERVIRLDFEHLDELGDLCRKQLIVEMMGKHSNLIFCREDGTIIDSIKHISSQVSSVREVLPGRMYFIPKTTDKKDPLTISEAEFTSVIKHSPLPVQKALYSCLTGFSPMIGEELCHLSSIDPDRPAGRLSEAELAHLSNMFSLMIDDVKNKVFTPNIIYHGEAPVEFSSLPLSCFQGDGFLEKRFESASSMLESYYSSRNTAARIKQKSADLRKIVQNALERNYKKYDLQLKQLRDTEKRGKYKKYGELLNIYGYELKGGENQFTCLDYSTETEISIPLDPALTARENAQKHFEKYNKLKRTFEALSQLVQDTKSEIDHLESINSALDIALREEDLVQIREELMEFGFLKRRYPGGKRPKITSRPFLYLSSDGFHIYVGKNNYQNEELTFKLASGNDWWFHAKGIPGSHVIVKSDGRQLTDRTFEEAASLAAYYSKGRSSEKVEVDYIQKKHVKKVAKSAPGFVIYHTNYSMVAQPKLELEEIPI